MTLYAEKNFIENIRNYSYDRQNIIPPILNSSNNNNNNNNQQETSSMLMRIFYTLFPFLKPTIYPVMLEYEEESESDNESKCETINDDENNITSFERYMFIKFGLTYHLKQNLTPVSSRGTLEDLENDEFEDYINEKYSRSVSSPY